MKCEINKNLITLKCVLFLFFGALGSLFPFLPNHMNGIGLSRDEFTIISIVSPLVAVIGPLVAAPLADRLAGGYGGSPRSKTGRYLRVMISVCLGLAIILYWLLLTVPRIQRSPSSVTFTCNEDGAFVLQNKCGHERTCHNWNGEKGEISLRDCTFSCNATTLYTGVPIPEPSPQTKENDTTTEDYYDDPANEAEPDFGTTIIPVSSSKANPGIVLSPHLCHKTDKDVTICDVYTKFSKTIQIPLSLKSNLATSSSNETDSDDEDICRYPVADYFHCRMPQEIVKELKATEDPNCQPVVLCAIHEPYTSASLLKTSECGYNAMSFWLYLVIRSIADIFPAAAVALLSTAVVIATRETSTGRSDIGKQLAAGALGFAIFAPIIGGCANGNLRDALICFTVLNLLAIVILLFDNNMPLSPPEWWWYTRCGLLALPMSSVRKYRNEVIALGVILFVLGILWNAIDAYLPWNAATMPDSSNLIIGLTVTMGAIPAISLLTFAEKVVDYCSHSNILILCFVTYVIHYVALANITEAAVLLIFEVLEIFTLHLMWITAILYLRHLVPRKYTALGQALPVIAHFCLGRCFGALIGRSAYTLYPEKVKYPDNHGPVYGGLAIAAAIIAALYFVAYHFYLKPYCVPHVQLPPYPAPSVVQSVNGNGSYTPLRVYHNGRAKKGHFRY
ncbi:uncharacterized protein LOC123004901 [Tribolium madens]|uniref:uncharacterized protein LOC123004901 n=1 Tax=Tribolium madens TaxID=41895 RepID=UPI001CF751BC|nr:uncharacterized protein LOC123004901 [Tribolium madens]